LGAVFFIFFANIDARPLDSWHFSVLYCFQLLKIARKIGKFKNIVMEKNNSKHTGCVPGYSGSFAELALAVGDMTYNEVALFISALSEDLKWQADCSLARHGFEAVRNLYAAIEHLQSVKDQIDSAWAICAPYMKGNYRHPEMIMGYNQTSEDLAQAIVNLGYDQVSAFIEKQAADFGRQADADMGRKPPRVKLAAYLYAAVDELWKAKIQLDIAWENGAPHILNQ
jgi:hypothetical protein